MHGEYDSYYQYLEGLHLDKATKDIKKNAESVVDQMKTRSKYSPDFASFRLYDNIPLLVYDNMMQGGNDNYFLRRCKYLGKGRTILDSYMVKRGIKNQIVAFYSSKNEMGGSIVGEVYIVTPDILLHLDELKQNNIFFKRIKTHTVFQDQYIKINNVHKNPTVACMMYISEKARWPYEAMKCIGSSVTKKNKRVFCYNPRNPMNNDAIFRDVEHQGYSPWGPTNLPILH